MDKGKVFKVEYIQSGIAGVNLTENGEAVVENTTRISDHCNERNKSEIFSYDTFEAPDELLRNRIIQQVEYLFSDANIQKDKFLLKHIRRNREGYVSLKLISSLRKVKALSKDWRIIAYSLQKSQRLQMNNEKTKIRRIEPLPSFEEKDSSRSVLVFHALPSCCTSESMMNLLKTLGTVLSISTVNSSTDKIDANIQKTLKLHENIVSFPFAVVTFETSDEASNAVLQTANPSSILKIVPIQEAEVATKQRNMPIAMTSKESIASKFCHSIEPSISIPPQPSSIPCSEYIRQVLIPKVNSSGQLQKYKCPKYEDKINAIKVLHLANQEQNVCHSEEKEMTLLPCTYKGDALINNKRIQRKHFFGLLKDSRVIILRQPRGPDGTRGFHGRKITVPSFFSAISNELKYF